MTIPDNECWKRNRPSLILLVECNMVNQVKNVTRMLISDTWENRIAISMAASRPCYSDILKHLLYSSFHWIRNDSRFQSKIFQMAVLSNNVPKVLCVYLFFRRIEIRADKMIADALQTSCSAGLLEMVKLILALHTKNNAPVVISKQIQDCFVSACNNGHVHVVKYMTSLFTNIGTTFNNNVIVNLDPFLF